jgi:choline dehydrogenase-like flavoprotein
LSNLLPSKQAVDVVVIGSGAGGGVIAKELADSGLSVVVLEAGKRYQPSVDYETDKQDFELRTMRTFLPEDDRRDTYTTAPGTNFLFNRVKGVGGSTLHYQAISPRLHESDFRVRTEDGVADDWPLTYAELEPYYTLVENALGVSGPNGPQANPFDPPRSQRFPTPPHEFNAATRQIKGGADKLGLHLVRDPVAIPSLDWDNRRACVSAGTCRLGCQIGAKSSIDVTYIAKGEATGRCEVRTGCMAREITVDVQGKVRSVIYFDPAGKEQEIAARAVVVAGNAVETPRLLLMSTSSKFPNGLANSSGLVGKYFAEHLSIFTYGVFEDRLEGWRGIPSGGMIQDFYATDKRNDYLRGATIIVETGWQWPYSLARRVGGWGASHRARMKKLFGHLAGLAIVGEQLPNERNTVTLDGTTKDLYGLPAPRITYQVQENDRAMVNTMRKRLKEILEAAGAIEIIEEEYILGNSSHYMGSCRMGSDPQRSVVDPWCRTHDIPNLFIGDGSVFVTVGAVNPALTISAIATRTAEGIILAFEQGDF